MCFTTIFLFMKQALFVNMTERFQIYFAMYIVIKFVNI
jgi:hypothetical protein